ncbi:gastrokine-1-like [Rhinatrema bivittatum]|uniref:gastrokine-1-like n=1 Tax=Rhinatrema bivittatum TaxID=194408 RepID=UPI001129ECE7|nr:gastrokine-1-like [Rhinatrema bivittatum]
MKLTILIASLLGVFLTPTLANDSVTLTNDGNDGSTVHQTVNINNENNVANIDTNNGWNSWNSVWDFNSGFAAVRPFAKKTCFVHKMNRKVVPNLQELARLTKQNKDKKGPAVPPPRSLQYTVTETRANNVAQFGKPVEALCRGVPTYYAQEMQGAGFFSLESCLDADLLWILRISFCGGIIF